MARLVGIISAALFFVFLLPFIFLQIDTTSFKESIINVLDKSGSSTENGLSHALGWKKPLGMEVIGLVFYGRKRYVTILEPYLRRNLVENGGILDKIIFVVNTNIDEDIQYLETLLASNSKYAADWINKEENVNWGKMYRVCEPGNIYVKIDDDILYIEDSTIQSIVEQKLQHPEYLGVSANIINSYATVWIHQHIGAIFPYLPELEPPKNESSTLTDWRTSHLPSWEGPANFTYETFNNTRNHTRWLPVPNSSVHYGKTPMNNVRHKLGGQGWHTWKLATQQHYSFFRNLENDELWRYRGFDLWVENEYDQVSANFFAITGDDVIEMSPIPSWDEHYITADYTEKTGRPFIISGGGVAVHYGYRSMAAANIDMKIDGTDVLDRYRMVSERDELV